MKSWTFKKFIPIIVILLITSVFFWKSIFKGLIPFPGDLLVGAYYPWLDYRWNGLTTSVPIKNPLISDVFSQFYLWKSLIADQIKQHQLPLWNIYSYSGYPLLANFHSGVFNPFNLLMVVFGKVNGWTLMVASQFFFAFLTMYYYLSQLFKSKFSALFGALAYSFSGFMFTWSQFVTAGFAMVWLPLIFLSIYKYFQKAKFHYLLFLPLLYFLLMTSGHFQALIYGVIFSALYFLYLLHLSGFPKLKSFILFFLVSLISLLLISIQIIPTLELSSLSVRFGENYISAYNYGLFSYDRLITLFAPDYFGNPSTNNFWGSFNYHETVIYMGIASIFSFIFSIYNFNKLKQNKFFFFSVIISLLLAFDTPIGKLIYLFNIPGLSTSAAGRIIFVYTFSLSVICAYFFDNINLHNFKSTSRYYWGYFLFLAFIIISTFILNKITQTWPEVSLLYRTSLRNSFYPLVFSSATLFILAFIRPVFLKRLLIFCILLFDLFRFGWKYLPFTDKQYLFPKSDVITYIQNQPGLFRVEKEKGPLFTPNTWTAYHLQSTSGYDPMALDSYSKYFQEKLNNQKPDSPPSRYSEIDFYNASNLGQANVKYLLALKYDQVDKYSPSGTHLNYKINQKDWKQVFEYGSVVVLENKFFTPRAQILNQPQSLVNITDYSPTKISLTATSDQDNSTLILKDTFYPGWKAYVNGQEVPIEKYEKIYRSIKIPSGNNYIEFRYIPESFRIGATASIIGLIVYLFLLILSKKTRFFSLPSKS